MKKITKAGLEKLRQELNFLKKDKRKELADRLQVAISFGDLSENAAYQEAKEEQTSVEDRINELERTIREAVVVGDDNQGDKIGIGSVVIIKSSDGEEKITIVGSEEADPLQGWISFSSPLGKNLIGKKKGDKVEVETPDGPIFYEVISLTSQEK